MRRNRKKKRPRHRVRDGPINPGTQSRDPVPARESPRDGGLRQAMKLFVRVAEFIAKLESVFKAYSVLRRIWGIVSRTNFTPRRTEDSSEARPQAACRYQTLAVEA
jgi:hypothetical protein